nr:TPA_asm: hypothetical protein [Micrarchus mononega-like virus 3]
MTRLFTGCVGILWLLFQFSEQGRIAVPVLQRETTLGFDKYQLPSDMFFDFEVIQSFEILRPNCSSSSISGEVRPLVSQCPESRQKRNAQRYNPLAYVGWLQSRIFGTVSSFDIEDLEVQSKELSHVVSQINAGLNNTSFKLTGLSHAVSLQQLEIQEFEVSLNTVSTDFVKLKSDFYTKYRSIFAGLSNSLNYLASLSLYRLLSATCHLGHVSWDLMDILLPKALSSVSKDIAGSNIQLMWTILNISSFMEYSMASCHQSENSIILSIIIPLKKTVPKEQLYSVSPLKFLTQGKTCSYQVPAKRLVRRDSVIYPIELSKYCTQGEQCLFRVTSGENHQGLQCYSYALTLSTPYQVYNHCNLKCHNYSGPSWTVLEGRRVSLQSQGESFLMSCLEGTNWNLQDIPMGDILILVPPQCQISIGFEVIVSVSYHHIPTPIQMRILVPLFHYSIPNLTIRFETENLTGMTHNQKIATDEKIKAILHRVDAISIDLPSHIPEIEWRSPFSFGWIAVLVGCLCCGLIALYCFSARGQAGFSFMSLLPCACASTVDDIIEVTTCLTLVAVIVLLLMTLIILVRLRRRLKCHTQSCCNESHMLGPHLDLRVLHDGKITSFFLLDLHPNESIGTSSFQRRVLTITRNEKSTVAALTLEVPIITSEGRTLHIPSPIKLPKSFPIGETYAWLCYSTM